MLNLPTLPGSFVSTKLLQVTSSCGLDVASSESSSVTGVAGAVAPTETDVPTVTSGAFVADKGEVVRVRSVVVVEVVVMGVVVVVVVVVVDVVVGVSVVVLDVAGGSVVGATVVFVSF